MKNTITTAVVAAILAAPFALQSGEVHVPSSKAVPLCDTGYIFGYGGYAFGEERDYQDTGLSLLLDYDDGYIVGGGAGLYSNFLAGSRFEIEGLYLNETDGLLTNQGLVLAASEMEAWAVMFNLLKEVPLGGITGYFGGGVGYGGVELNLINGPRFCQNDNTVAYQFIAGGDIPVGDCVALFLQYKLLGFGETDYQFGGRNQTHDSFISHSVSAGLRISF